MRLRKVKNRGANDDWQKCCRFCHHYFNGVCNNEKVTTAEVEFDLDSVVEQGYLDETLQETLNGVSLETFRDLEYKLREWKISEERIKEFNDLFGQLYTQFADMVLKPELSENVDRCYHNHVVYPESEGIEISDPYNFVCGDWC